VPELSIVPLVIMPIGREPALAVLGGATMYLASSPCGRLKCVADARDPVIAAPQHILNLPVDGELALDIGLGEAPHIEAQ